jgi:hypothetical protein
VGRPPDDGDRVADRAAGQLFSQLTGGGLGCRPAGGDGLPAVRRGRRRTGDARLSMGDDRFPASMRMVTVKFLTVAFWQVG